MRRSVRISAWILGSLAALLMLVTVAVLVVGNTDAGRGLIERLTYRSTGGNVKLTGLGGSFPANLTLDRLELIDRGGVWLTAEHIALRWSPSALIEQRIRANSLTVARLDMERTPLPSGKPSTGKPWVPQVDIDQFSIDVLQLGAALAGRPATLSIAGNGRMVSLEDARVDVQAHRIDRDGVGDYTLNLRFDPHRMDGRLTVHEPASGPLENILQVPGLGALSANVSIAGPHNAEQIDLELSAGDLKAQVRGSVDLRNGSLDLDYSLAAPQVSPRPDLKWQRVALAGRWKGPYTDPTADGHLEIDRLVLPAGTAIAALHADINAAGGGVTLKALVEGLRIPGSQPALLETDLLKIDASMRLKEPTRPLTLSATHRLFALSANAVTTGRQNAAFELRIPSIAPFAALAGQALKGDATVKGRIERRENDVALSLDAAAVLAGAGPSWTAIVGNRVTLGLSGAFSDSAFTVDRLKLAGTAWSMSASGTAQRPGFTAPAAASPAGASPAANGAASPVGLAAVVKSLDARFTLDIANLGIVGSSLQGMLQASGRLSGPAASLAADVTMKSMLSLRGSPPGAVTAELHARGLPGAPSASIAANGTVDGSPLDIAVTLARAGRAGLRAKIDRGAWKSAKLQGDWLMESTLAESRGQLHVQVGELGDLDHLIGRDVRGKLAANALFTPKSGSTHAEFDVDVENLASSQFTGTVHLSGEGSTDAVAAKLDVKSPDVMGFPAAISADAAVDLEHDNVRVLHGVADYRGQKFRLLAPAKLSYSPAISIDALRVGAQSAVLDVHGELSPQLDLHASLSHVDPPLINVLAPDFVSQGTIEASARLRGTLAAPTGHLQLAARGFRFAADEAVGLPAVDLNAGAELNGNSAAIDVKLNAGSNPLLSARGDVPLEPAGVYDLKVEGKMDLGNANALLEARGFHTSGELAIDANVGGTLADPRIHGSVTLANGSFRDYVRGINLTNIGAEITGNQGTLQIKSFKASAASGTLSMAGSVGVLQPGIPVDIKVTAANAQPIASSFLTANLNADIHITGRAREQLAVVGTIHVNRAVIGIPDSLPPNVAVLDVRRRGKVVEVPGKQLVIDLDITIKAEREVLVQGRGLDAELGGENLHIGGTVSEPVITGRLGLLRGTFSIGSTQLTFDPTSNVSFDGTGLKKSIDPTLDFTANNFVQTTTSSAQAGTQVTLHITGYADSPKIALTSTGGQSQDEIMALLLFGVPASQLSALQLAQVSYALATLSGIGGSGSANPLTRLQKSLGLDRLSVGSGTTTSATGATENSGAAIQAGRYVTKRVYVEGKQSTTGQTQVEVDVDLTKHLKLQTRLGNGTAVQGTTPQNDPGSSVGLSYQFEY
jgi:translocation and assembly module TamB